MSDITRYAKINAMENIPDSNLSHLLIHQNSQLVSRLLELEKLVAEKQARLDKTAVAVTRLLEVLAKHYPDLRKMIYE